MIVSDTSSLINLARIGELNLLNKLYGEIIVPEAVWKEVVVDGVGRPGAEDIQKADWIKRAPVKNRNLVRALMLDLDAGEAQAIALSLELEAELLLMDERLGRESAHYFGLRYIGLIGVLIEAKHRGLILDVKSSLDTLRDKAGFRIAQSLYERVLRDQKE